MAYTLTEHKTKQSDVTMGEHLSLQMKQNTSQSIIFYVKLSNYTKNRLDVGAYSSMLQ